LKSLNDFFITIILGITTIHNKVRPVILLQVRNGPGDDGLMVYHTDEPCNYGDATNSSSARTKVKGEHLAAELSSGRYRLAVVRCLHRRLSDDQIALVKEYVALNEGKTFEDDSHPSSILMASPSSGSTAFERLCCSEFVAMMLHLIGAVAPTDIPFEYAATHPKGKLIRSTMVLQPANDRASSTKHVTLFHDQSPQDTDTPSPRTCSSEGAGTPQNHSGSFVSPFSSVQKAPPTGVPSEAISVVAM
jgi:hypothetical protein